MYKIQMCGIYVNNNECYAQLCVDKYLPVEFKKQAMPKVYK